jgi:membrane fusion protein, copper/silver efflux system
MTARRGRVTRVRAGRMGAVLLSGAVLLGAAAGQGCGHVDETSHVAAASAPAAKPKAKFHCPMHPEYTSDTQGDCPICGMRLTPIEPAAGSGGTPATKEAPTSGSGATPTTVPAALDLGDRARVAGVRTVAATPGTLTRSIRAVGTVTIDETRVRQVTTKVGGFVEQLYVTATGQMVRAGEPLLDLYSPELLVSQEEYLRARQSAATFQASTVPEVRKGGADLAAAARRRLELFDVPQEFIERLETTGQAQRTITFHAPFAGFVTGKNVVVGQRIESGNDLFMVTDLSHVWVMAQVFEIEARAAQPGRPVRVTLPYDAAVTLSGRIGFVYPTLDTDARTLKVRLEFDNPRGALKPGMFVDVELPAETATGLLVPDGAVIDSGTRQLVFVETTTGHFETRDVQVAARADGQAVIRQGLKAGEAVATSANFLLDSESRLRQAAAGGRTHQEP